MHYIVTKSLSPAVFEIMGTKHIGVMTLTFQGHVTSSVTLPFDSQEGEGGISYRHYIVTKSQSPAVSEIMGTKHIGGNDLDLSGSRDVIGHVTIGLGVVISYWWSFGPKYLSTTVSEIFRPKHHVLIDTMLNRHCACVL